MATPAFPSRRSFRQRVDRQATATRTERFAAIRGPANALERVARLVVRHPKDAAEA
jgi:hypothetical protein